MISNDNFRILTPEEESQYKFPFCRHCEFYPCELVGECGSVNEIPEIHESQIPILRGRIVATSTEQSKNTEKYTWQRLFLQYMISTMEILSQIHLIVIPPVRMLIGQYDCHTTKRTLRLIVS